LVYWNIKEMPIKMLYKTVCYLFIVY
jgi:hypothetical protein